MVSLAGASASARSSRHLPAFTTASGHTSPSRINAVEHISSRENAVVKRFRQVAREGRLGHTVLLDGAHLLGEALDSAVELEIVASSDSAAQGTGRALLERSAAAGARVITVPGSVLDSISPVRNPSGTVALAHLAPAPLDAAVGARPPQLILVLDGVQDPGNVGAIVRTAEACGATAVITTGASADPFGWKALRGSMGSAFRLPVASVPRIEDALEAVRSKGVRIFATVPRGGTLLRAANLAAPAAILLGGEGAGLRADLIDTADQQLTIEMRPPVESLNVSVAAALVLYEASRQRADVAVR